jgi:hypothetical protein
MLAGGFHAHGCAGCRSARIAWNVTWTVLWHSLTGPALRYPDGWGVYAIHGVRVPAPWIETPDAVIAYDVLEMKNVEARRVMIERIGAERFIKNLPACPVARDDFGTLYRVPSSDEEPLTLVEVVNGTPEPDGTRKHYFLRVPPHVQTAREAVAWTYDVPANDYTPEVRT